MSWTGLLIGLSVFVITGLLHPVVIKCEYYFGKRCWPVFAALGLVCCTISLLWAHIIGSILFAVLGFSFFWAVKEQLAQEERVKKGWFTGNPKKRGAAPNA